MKRFSVPTAILAAFLVASVAFAAKDRVVVSFQSLSNSGVSGEVTLMAMPQGGTMIHGKIRGLTANSEYVSQAFTDGSCTASPAVELSRYKANNNGMAQFNLKSTKTIEEIKSISVQTGGDLTLQACAPVTE